MEKLVTKITDPIIEGLKIATVELEEFQLQFALGQAEASDKYEEVKKKMNNFIHEIKEKLRSEKGDVDTLNKKMEVLQKLFLLGKVETREAFEEQKKELFSIIHEIEEFLLKNKIGLDLHYKIKIELEKLKIKMEVIGLKFDLKKIDVKENIKKMKGDFFESLDKIKDKFSEKLNSKESNHYRDEFFNELNQAYIHLKKAFKH